MKRFFTLTLLGVLCLAICTAHAAKTGSSVTPESLEAHGFSMKVENQADGTVEFTLVRDLSKAMKFPADSGLQISRYATLRVSDKSGLRARCELAPNTRDQGMVTYRFTIARSKSDATSKDRHSLGMIWLMTLSAIAAPQLHATNQASHPLDLLRCRPTNRRRQRGSVPRARALEVRPGWFVRHVPFSPCSPEFVRD